jgi:hypothetical protein
VAEAAIGVVTPPQLWRKGSAGSVVLYMAIALLSLSALFYLVHQDPRQRRETIEANRRSRRRKSRFFPAGAGLFDLACLWNAPRMTNRYRAY